MTRDLRPATMQDIAALSKVVEQTDLFPPEILEEMLRPVIDGEDEAIWLVHEQHGTANGFVYAIPEPLTEGTWNMLALAVLPEKQRTGAGKALVSALENALRPLGARLLIADTSGTDSFEGTRAFYARVGYAEEARIRDFWEAGDDKVTFRKAL